MRIPIILLLISLCLAGAAGGLATSGYNEVEPFTDQCIFKEEPMEAEPQPVGEDTEPHETVSDPEPAEEPVEPDAPAESDPSDPETLSEPTEPAEPEAE